MIQPSQKQEGTTAQADAAGDTNRQNSSQPQNDNDTGQPARQGQSPAEWVTFGISLAIFVMLVGLVGFLNFSSSSRLPEIEMQPQLDQIRQVKDLYYLPIEVMNQGDRSAEQVMVRVTLASNDAGEETTEFIIQFLAGRATAKGTVVFRQDPRQGKLEAQCISYIKP